MNAFVTIPYNVGALRHDVISKMEPQSWVVCEGMYELDEGQITILQEAETIFFVVSSVSMCSTAYQMLVFATVPHLNKEKCRLLNLNDTKIPLGFHLLQDFPDAVLSKAL